MKIKFDHNATHTHEAFGVSRKRIVELTEQLNEVGATRASKASQQVEALLFITEDPKEILCMTYLMGAYSK